MTDSGHHQTDIIDKLERQLAAAVEAREAAEEVQVRMTDAHVETYERAEAAEAEVGRLKARLDEIADQHRRVMADECPSDEKHCPCVPVLRREVEAMGPRPGGKEDE